MADSEGPLPSSSLASIEHTRDFRYFGNNNYPVKLTKATISTTPVDGGKLLKFDISAVTDQVILRGEGELEFLLNGVKIHTDSQKFNLCHVVSCPISVGDFLLGFCSVIPADMRPGSYTFKLDLHNQNGRQLTCVAFNYTIPVDNTLRYPDA